MNKSWILLLNKNSSNVNKEQINGLEAIGSIVTEDKNENSTPMDEADGKTDDTTSSVNSKDDETSNLSNDTGDTDSDITNVDDGNDVASNTDEIDGDKTSDIDSNLDQSSSNTTQNPNFIQERRILLSNKLLKLYDSINESINFLINGPSFQNKPVILDELTDLSNIVDTINESINKEPDHKVILLKYALCIKTYNRIMNSI